MTMQTRCQGSQLLRGYGIRVVNNYADVRFSRTSSRNQKILQNRFRMFIWGQGRIFQGRVFFIKRAENLMTLKINVPFLLPSLVSSLMRPEVRPATSRRRPGRPSSRATTSSARGSEIITTRTFSTPPPPPSPYWQEVS